MDRKFLVLLTCFALLSSFLWIVPTPVEAFGSGTEPYYAMEALADGVHDIAIVDVSVYLNETIEGKEDISIQVAVRNEGNYAEGFNVTVSANQTADTIFVDAYLVTTLGSMDQISIPFVWHTAEVDSGN